jgi:hypothetical protein
MPARPRKHITEFLPRKQKTTVTPLGPDAPWATQEVVVRKGKEVVSTRIEAVYKPKPTPWARQPEDAKLVQPAPPKAPETAPPTKPHKKKVREEEATRLISAQNYAAVEAGAREFGVIDMGEGQGTRSVVVHVPKSSAPWLVLDPIRPGAALTVRPVAGGEPVHLRVRSTTPSRYYSPGAKVTTLAVAVDSADWQSLMVGARSI